MLREVTAKAVYKKFTVSADGIDEAHGEADAWMKENAVAIDHIEYEMVPVVNEAFPGAYRY